MTYKGCPSEERQAIMMTKASMIKHYLLAITLITALGSGCQSLGDKKPGKNYSLIMLYLEQNNDGTKYSRKMAVYRADPVIFYVNSEPFLSTADLEKATLMEAIGGFALQLQFDRHGTAVLESFTTSNKGRRMAIFCQFTEPRVLAAPMITKRNATGIIRFTPDCSREEAERIINGLAAAIKEIKSKSK
jgi:preprotein translocase subunit SecD